MNVMYIRSTEYGVQSTEFGEYLDRESIYGLVPSPESVIFLFSIELEDNLLDNLLDNSLYNPWTFPKMESSHLSLIDLSPQLHTSIAPLVLLCILISTFFSFLSFFLFFSYFRIFFFNI